MDGAEQIPRLYYPKSAEELLTLPILQKLMLGFAAGLEEDEVDGQERQAPCTGSPSGCRRSRHVPVMMQDRSGAKYDLYPRPEQYWCKFCSMLRAELGLGYDCDEMDKQVAKTLLTGTPEKDLKRFGNAPFACHLGLIDMARAIRVGGQPFAVLHGGQIRPADLDAWEREYKPRIEELLRAPSKNDEGQKGQQIGCTERLRQPDLFHVDKAQGQLTVLISAVRNMPEIKGKELDNVYTLFTGFAKEIEELLNKVYLQHRMASEEAILRVVIERMSTTTASSWDVYRMQIATVLAQIREACGLSRLALLLSRDPEHPFLCEIQATSPVCDTGASFDATQLDSDSPTGSVLLDTQPWATALRETLGLTPHETFWVAAVPCMIGSPSMRFPCLLAAGGTDATVPGASEFLARLVGEITRPLVATTNQLNVAEVQDKAASQAALGAHSVKLPIQAAIGLAESLQSDMVRTGVKDPEMLRKAAELVAALAKTRAKSGRLEEAPVREMEIQPRFEMVSVVPVIEEAMRMAQDAGETNRDVTVRWKEKPDSDFVLVADPEYLSMALDAILENAVKYSFERHAVTVAATMGDSWFTLAVSDLGVPAPDNVIAGRFDFGKRGGTEDEYRGHSRKGAGLGLAIASRIIKAHHGEISVTSRPIDDRPKPHLVTVTIRLLRYRKGSQ